MDSLRGAAILLVISYHSQTVLSRFVPETPEALPAALSLFAPFRMPVLMFLSGMLLERSLRKPTKDYFLGKLRAIGWPYLLWSVVFLVVSAQVTPRSLVRIVIEPPTYLWYLWFLLLYYVGMWVVRALRLPAWLPAVVGFVGTSGPEAHRFSRFWFLLVFFTLGHLYARYRAQETRPTNPVVGRVLLPVAVVVVVAGAVANAAEVPVQYNPVFVLVPLSGVFLCTTLLPTARTGRISGLLAVVGRDSIVFYVTHFTVAWLVCWWLREAGVQEVAVMYPAAAVAAVGVGLMLVPLRRNVPAVAALFTFPRRRMASAEPRRSTGAPSANGGRS